MSEWGYGGENGKLSFGYINFLVNFEAYIQNDPGMNQTGSFIKPISGQVLYQLLENNN